jgi:hypothetical protein
MITIFTLPKPFTGANRVSQLNATLSWQQLRPKCEIILCGDEPGVAEICTQYGWLHMPDIAVNEYGTPRLDQTFARVQAVAEHRLVCYINTDIILLSDFMTAIQRIRYRRYLVVGTRWNLNLTEPVDFSAQDWEAQIKERVIKEGALQPPLGSDYFLFEKGSLGELPPFVVGRPGWDNWMIYRARTLKMPVIDATQACMVVHQNHDYGHVPDRYNPRDYAGPEADRNLMLMGGNRTRFTLLDATHLLTQKGQYPAWGLPYIKRRIRTLAALHPKLRPLADLAKRAHRK